MKLLVYGFFVLFQLAGVASHARDYPTLTVFNQASESAAVRIVGPTSRYLELAPGASQTAGVSGGVYHLLVRYCDRGGGCRYSKSDPFAVTQTSYSVSRITVTLHSASGNLGERSSSESEFGRSW